MEKLFQANTTSQRVRIFIKDSTTFMGKTGLLFSTAGLAFAYSNGPSDTAHDIALVTQTVGGAWASGGFVEVDATKEPGWYQFDIPDAILSSVNGFSAQIVWRGTGILDDGIDIELTSYNPNTIDKTDFSLSAAAIQAIWQQAIASITLAGSIGKLLGDNLAVAKTNTDAIKSKTDALTLTSGAVTVAPHGLDGVIGYHPAGDA